MAQFQKGNSFGRGRPKGSVNKASAEIRETITNLINNELKNILDYKAKVSEEKWLDFLVKALPYATPKQTEVEQTLIIEEDNSTKVHGVEFNNWLKLLGKTEGNVSEAMEIYDLLNPKPNELKN